MNTTPALLSQFALAQTEMGAAPPSGGADMMGGAAPAGGAPGTTGAPGTSGAPGTPGGPTGRPAGLFDSGFTLIIVMVGMLVLMMWTTSRRQKKEQAQRQTMMNSLAKGDVVVTVGGIKGTIAEDPAGKDDIVLIVDETTRNRIRFVKTAVSSVVRDNHTASAVEPKAEANRAVTA